MADASITFLIDEHLPVEQLSGLLRERGHSVRAVQVGFKDPSIIVTADEIGAVIITADTWFLRELFRFPAAHRRRYKRASVVQVSGEWDSARARIIEYMPVIEALFLVRARQADPRMGVDLSGAVVHIR